MRKAWEPNPGSQRLFLSCPIREVLNEGTRGSGKTEVLLIDYAQHCGSDNRTRAERRAGVAQRSGFGEAWRGILFRRTYPQLADVVAKSRRWFKLIFGDAAKFNSADYVWTWRTGEQLFLRHFGRSEDYWNYHGHEYPFVGFEELTAWSTLDCYESMLACNRSSDPRVPRKYRSTTNPFGAGHAAVKRYFIDPAPAGHVICEEREIPAIENDQLIRKKVLAKRVRIHSSYIENPKLLVNDPMYLANIERITDANKRKAWLFGDWNVNAGGLFQDLWDEKRHVIRPFTIPSSWQIDRALDWGSSRPFSVGWWAESDGTTATMADGSPRTFPAGTLFRVAEWYGCSKDRPNEGLKMTARSVAKGIVERESSLVMLKGRRIAAGPADSSIYDVTDERSIAQNMADEGVSWKPADKRPGSRKNGWELFRDRLESVLLAPDRPGIYVFDQTCRDFIRTVPDLPRSEKDPDDVDTEAEDHIADETRYRLLGPAPLATKIDLGFAH